MKLYTEMELISEKGLVVEAWEVLRDDAMAALRTVDLDMKRATKGIIPVKNDMHTSCVQTILTQVEKLAAFPQSEALLELTVTGIAQEFGKAYEVEKVGDSYEVYIRNSRPKPRPVIERVADVGEEMVETSKDYLLAVAIFLAGIAIFGFNGIYMIPLLFVAGGIIAVWAMFFRGLFGKD